MRVGLLGRKVGMTQIYKENGIVVPVTVLECGPCTVLQVRTAERDGYHALQLGFDDKKRKNATQAARGHAKQGERRAQAVRSGGPPGRPDRGQRRANPHGRSLQRRSARRRDRHQQGPRLCGRHQAARIPWPSCLARCEADAPPSRLVRPSADPARTQKGIRKPGHMGNATVTVRNLEVVQVDPANNLLLIKGAVPGPNGGYITIRQTNKV